MSADTELLPAKMEVTINGIAAETHAADWSAADGIGFSVQGQHLLIAVHHKGETHAVWLSGELLDHVAGQLADAAREIMQSRMKCEQAAARWGTVQ